MTMGFIGSRFCITRTFCATIVLVLLGVYFQIPNLLHGYTKLQPQAEESSSGARAPQRADGDRFGDVPSAHDKRLDVHASLSVHGNLTGSLEEEKGRSPSSAVIPGLQIDIDERVPSVDDLYDRIAIVSAFSQNHYLEAMAFIATAQQTMPDKKIIIYDLGIKQSTLKKVRELCNVEVRQFPWSSYPPHVKNLLNYAWKPVLIDITLKEFGAIFWGDASVRFQRSLREVLPYAVKHHGYMSHWHSFDPKVTTLVKHQYYFTNAKMFNKLGIDRRKYYESKNLAAYPAANRQLYINGSVITREVLQPMLECALVLECIAPEGSKVGSHRFDASLLALLIYKNMQGEWTPTNNDNDVFDKVIGIQRSNKGGEKVKSCSK